MIREKRNSVDRKAVVTGIGIVSPIGNSKEEFARALREGRSGEGEIRQFDTSDFPVKRACEVKDFTPPLAVNFPEQPLTAKSPLPPFFKGGIQGGFSDLDPFILYALDAAEQALRDSGLDWSQVDRERFGAVVSSSKGGVRTLEGAGSVTWHLLTPDRASFWIAKKYALRGPLKCVVTACATGTSSIIEGARLIERGEADLCLAGASDASITPVILAGYRQMGVYSENGMCPYDRRRTGFLVGEGAGVILLEEKAFARARGARIYGEILSHTEASDSYHITSFNREEEGLASLLKQVLRKADLSFEDLDYLNTHGTSTPEGDRYETLQIKKAFGKKAYQIPCSATKSMVGHMLGASGAVELIACLLALEQGFIPPTIHYEVPDPECDLDYTVNQSREARLRTACSFSMGFGGHLAALVVGKR